MDRRDGELVATAGADSEPDGLRLQAESGYTPVYLRTTPGGMCPENGHHLAGLLDDLVATWPEQVDELLLLGHSMGGLVIRSACHYGREFAAWVDRVRHVFYLGTPHLGAPLARARRVRGLGSLRKAAETRPFVTLVNGSSPGIKDLRHGYVLADDWADCDQDSCVRDHRHDTPLLAGANHYAISATDHRRSRSPARRRGRRPARPASQRARQARRVTSTSPSRPASRRGLGGMHHLDLLNHPAVWISDPRPAQHHGAAVATAIARGHWLPAQCLCQRRPEGMTLRPGAARIAAADKPARNG